MRMRWPLVIAGVGLIAIGIFGVTGSMFSGFGNSLQNVVDTAVDGPQASEVCQPGETLEQETGASVYTPGQGYGRNVHYYCVNVKGDRREVTGEFVEDLMGETSGLFSAFQPRIEFLLLSGLGMLLLLGGVVVGGRRRGVSEGVALYGNQTSTSPISGMGQIENLSPDLAQMIQQAQSMQSDMMRSMQSGVATSGDDLASKLKQLEEAKTAGLISQSEYDRKRQEILDSLT